MGEKIEALRAIATRSLGERKRDSNAGGGRRNTESKRGEGYR